MVSYNSYRTAVLHYIDDAQGFLFFWSLSVVCTGLTLGKYFVHVNICLIAPPETWDVCFQVVVSGLCVQCSYLSGSAVTLAVCILFNLAGSRFIYTTTTKKSREASRHLLTHNWHRIIGNRSPAVVYACKQSWWTHKKKSCTSQITGQ